jgi:hypothetical protein
MNECISKYTGATSQQAKDLSKDFYGDTCVLKEGADGEQRPGSTPNEEIITPPESPAQSPPDDQTAGKLSLIAGLTSSLITIAGVAWWFFHRMLLRGKLSYPPTCCAKSTDQNSELGAQYFAAR